MDSVVDFLGCWSIAVLVALLAGCSSTGSVVTIDITVTNTVTLQSPIDPEVATYAPKFIAVLEKPGFKVGETKNMHAMQLRLAFNGNPFDTRVVAELWYEGVPILTAYGFREEAVRAAPAPPHRLRTE